MDTALSPELSAFRDEVRSFIADNLPDDLRRAARRTPSVFHDPDVSLPWQRILNARGWAAPDWPVEFGGPGWDAVQRYIFISECVAADAPHLAPMGLKMVAPVLMHYGTPQQQAYHLPRILSGEDYWCQGFSEPGSGSDLASLRLRADRDGTDYVLNGSKIWTTHAHFANRMFCLVRTSNDGKPQAGISFLLIDMDTPGIRVSPIHTLAGDHELNQVFFDDVRVPQANRLGAENDGWSVAKHLLAFERGGVYAPALVARLREVEQACPDDPVLRQKIARQAVSLEALQAIELKALRKEGPTAMYPSILKVLGTEASQAIDVLACDILGTPGWRAREADLPDDIAVTVPRYLNNRAASIYAGSNEIQRDIIAKMMLG